MVISRWVINDLSPHFVSNVIPPMLAWGRALKEKERERRPWAGIVSSKDFSALSRVTPFISLMVTITFSSLSFLEKTEKIDSNISPGATAFGREGSKTTSLWIVRGREMEPKAAPPVATAMRRPFPLNSGNLKVTTALPFPSVLIFPSKRERISRERPVRRGDKRPPIAAYMASALPPPAGWRSGVSRDSKGMSRSYMSFVKIDSSLFPRKNSSGAGVLYPERPKIPSSTRATAMSPCMGFPR